jgi:hypothetical protein
MHILSRTQHRTAPRPSLIHQAERTRLRLKASRPTSFDIYRRVHSEAFAVSTCGAPRATGATCDILIVVRRILPAFGSQIPSSASLPHSAIRLSHHPYIPSCFSIPYVVTISSNHSPDSTLIGTDDPTQWHSTEDKKGSKKSSPPGKKIS